MDHERKSLRKRSHIHLAHLCYRYIKMRLHKEGKVPTRLASVLTADDDNDNDQLTKVGRQTVF